MYVLYSRNKIIFLKFFKMETIHKLGRSAGHGPIVIPLFLKIYFEMTVKLDGEYGDDLTITTWQ